MQQGGGMRDDSLKEESDTQQNDAQGGDAQFHWPLQRDAGDASDCGDPRDQNPNDVRDEDDHLDHQYPRLIHQTWKDNFIPSKWTAYHESWRRHHPVPHWEHRLWTDDMCRQLLATSYPEYLALYDSFPQTIQRVDFWRYAALHRYGGVYADLDCESLQSLEPLLKAMQARNAKIILGQTDGRIECAFMISTPRHPMWLALMAHIQRRMNNLPLWLRVVSDTTSLGVLWTTGPFALTRFVRENTKKTAGSSVGKRAPVPSWASSDVVVAPEHYFYPHSWLDRQRQLSLPESLPADSYVRHHYSDSWLSSKEQAAVNVVTSSTGRLWLLGLALAIIVIAALLTWFAVARSREKKKGSKTRIPGVVVGDTSRCGATTDQCDTS